jgi:hypothetical protein
MPLSILLQAITSVCDSPCGLATTKPKCEGGSVAKILLCALCLSRHSSNKATADVSSEAGGKILTKMCLNK